MTDTAQPPPGALEQDISNILWAGGVEEDPLRARLLTLARGQDAERDRLRDQLDEALTRERAQGETHNLMVSELRAVNAQLLAAAQTIRDVSTNATRRVAAPPCPHGTVPSYPTHARWCDDCWDALDAAIALAKNSGASA